MENDKEKIVLWGIGRNAFDILNHSCFFEDTMQIVCLIDSSAKRWGEKVCGLAIKPPSCIKNMQFDKIVIVPELYYEEIRKTITDELQIDAAFIENGYYFAKVKLMARYKDSQDEDLKSFVRFWGQNELQIFNYPFAGKYVHMQADIGYDETAKMYYVMHLGKRMYMSRQLDTERKVLDYYRSICVEQDEKSPHLYLRNDFPVNDGDVVVDIGVAEGNFSLGIIDKASKIYMIEADRDWVRALEYTFAEYRDKTVIINRFVSDYTLGNVDTLDNMIQEPVNFVKMDIEGCEKEALAGSKQLIQRSEKIKYAVCAYHSDNDEVCIDHMAGGLGLTGCPAEGYMWYPVGEKQLYISPILRRGVLRYEKQS